jgi:hypothetical protein
MRTASTRGREAPTHDHGGESCRTRAGVAPHLFTGFDAARFPDSTIDALGLTAEPYKLDVRVGEQASLRLRKALFEDGQDLTDRAQLRSIGRAFASNR